MPDGCRTLAVSVLDASGGRLCVLQLEQREGVLEQLQDVVSENEFWVRCDLLEAELAE